MSVMIPLQGPTTRLDRQRKRARISAIASQLRDYQPPSTQEILAAAHARRDQQAAISPVPAQRREAVTLFLPTLMAERELFERIFAGPDRVSREARAWLRQRDRDQAGQPPVPHEPQRSRATENSGP